MTTGNDDLKDGEVLSPYRSVYRPFRGAELAKEFGRGYEMLGDAAPKLPLWGVYAALGADPWDRNIGS